MKPPFLPHAPQLALSGFLRVFFRQKQQDSVYSLCEVLTAQGRGFGASHRFLRDSAGGPRFSAAAGREQEAVVEPGGPGGSSAEGAAAICTVNALVRVCGTPRPAPRTEGRIGTVRRREPGLRGGAAP